MENEEIASMLEQVADLLEAQDGNPFRIGSYRRAAATVRDCSESVAEMAEEGGRDRLQELPGVGSGLAGAIDEIVHTGRLSLLDRLQGEVSPGQTFTKVPGIGEKLAERIASELDVTTLEELETAAHDGRLERVEGVGSKKIEGIREALAGMLSQSAQRKSRQRQKGEEPPEDPPLELLLTLDRQYREKAEAGELKTIAPKRFNPEGKPWLPIMKTSRQGWDFTLLFSNTARAHEKNKTHDWVVIYYERAGAQGQCTVVTGSHGVLEGKRIIPDRIPECANYYASASEDD